MTKSEQQRKPDSLVLVYLFLLLHKKGGKGFYSYFMCYTVFYSWKMAPFKANIIIKIKYESTYSYIVQLYEKASLRVYNKNIYFP